MSAIAVKLAESDADIRRCYPVMRALRTHIATAEEFLERVRRQQKFGWRLIYVEDQGEPVAASGFRVSEWLVTGKTLYVDDLVALESHRGKGYAEALMNWMMETGRREGCGIIELDSGTHRLGAHRFYHRLKMSVIGFHFQRKL